MRRLKPTVAPSSDESRFLLPTSLAGNTVESLYAAHGPERSWIYWLLLLGIGSALASLPLIKVDVSVRAPGMVRPATERMDLRPAVSGQIRQVLVRDNERVKLGQPLLVLNAGDLEVRLARNQALQAEHAATVADLVRLTGGISADRPAVAGDFQTPALRQEFVQNQAQLDSYRLAEAKARNELARYAALAANGIATQQELDNARYAVERLHSESGLSVEQNLSRWQSRLQEEQTALAGLTSDAQRMQEEITHYTLQAPANGVLVGFTGWSPGGFVTAGQALGVVSPDDILLVETHVSTRDVGLVRIGQTVRLQIDAYPYTQWGSLDGKVVAISGDLVISDASTAATNLMPAFKVMIRPAAGYLSLPNGVRGELKKGLTLSARFLVTRRSVLQLLYDDVSAWLNPQDERPTT
jgi:HlyD family secretion protein